MMKWHKLADEEPMPGTLCLCKTIDKDGIKHYFTLVFKPVYPFTSNSHPWAIMDNAIEFPRQCGEYWLAITEIEGNITHEME